MPRRRYCSKCIKRLPDSAERCVACGGPPRVDDKPQHHGRTAALVVVLAFVTVLAVGFSDRYVPAVADWYSRMVIRYMPESALQYMPADDDRRAFYICARSVVRQIEDDGSIVTFAADGLNDLAVPLGSDVYQVRSFVEEAQSNGSTQRRAFTCTLRRDNDSWTVEEVVLEPLRTAVAAS